MINNILVEQPFACKYCSKKFIQEKTLFTHVCEKKRRYLAKDDKHVKIGYLAFVKFFRFTSPAKHDKTYDEFANSPYYNAFVKFGSFVSNINPLYPENFIDWVIKSGIKLDHWCKDELYDQYVIHLIYSESVETALERSVTTMENWAKDHNSVWNHYFRYVSLNRAMFDIKDGKISPWLILNSPSGKQLLNKFDPKQLESISTAINPKLWIEKFKNQKNDLELVMNVVKVSDL